MKYLSSYRNFITKDENEEQDSTEKRMNCIARGVAASPHLNEKLMIELSKSSDPSIRLALATNPSLPVLIQILLSKDSFDSIKIALINNPNVENEVLDNLVYDESAVVSCEALKKTTSCRTIDVILKEGSRVQRAALIDNPFLSSDQINQLKNDSDYYVRDVVRKGIKAETLSGSHPGVWGHEVKFQVFCDSVISLANSFGIDSLMLDMIRPVFSMYIENDYRLDSSSLSNGGIEKMFSMILLSLASDPNLPADNLVQFIEYDNEEIICAALSNESFPNIKLKSYERIVSNAIENGLIHIEDQDE